MNKKLKIGKKLILNKENLNQLNEDQLTNFLGGRMMAATQYTQSNSHCDLSNSSYCSTGSTYCCG